MSRVEFGRSLFDGEDADRGWKAVVENFTAINRRESGLGRKTGDLGARVHAGIGASGALRKDLFAGCPSSNIGENSLHRWAVRLNLPSMEFGAVVSDRQFEITGHVEFAGSRTSL